MKNVKILSLLLPVVLLALALCACGKEEVKPEGLRFTNDVSDIVYILGEEFGHKDELGLSKVPGVAVDYTDGSTKDISSEVAFSGYDKDKEGKQTVTAKATVDGVTLTKTYEVTVRVPQMTELIVNSSFEAVEFFKVGDVYSVEATMPGTSTKVSVFLMAKYDDGSIRDIGYLNRMEGVEVDLSRLKLDIELKFTEAGVFPVKLTYNGFTAEYKIKVGEAAAEENRTLCTI